MSKDEKKIVLAKASLFEGESQGDYKAPNIVQCILSLFRNIQPGADLIRFQLPTTFNLPKSQLQSFGESVYCTNKDLLSICNNCESPLERLTGVVAWCISTTRPIIFGLSPYNPILGETHHVSTGSLNVLLEQVFHHPPVFALHATNEKENIELIWCQQPVAKFCGTSVEAQTHGKRQLKLHKYKETYEMNSPKLLVRILPVPRTDWVGNVKIKCHEGGLEAELCFRGGSLLGRRGRAIKGKIYESLSIQTLYEIDGHWDRTVSVKDMQNGERKVIFDAKEVLYGLKTPVVMDSQAVWATESAAVWGDVSQGILNQEWEKARVAKKGVEEEQRRVLRERESVGETWVPKHFNVTKSGEMGWDCSPIQEIVPPAPIVVPP
ncbi:oxysterol-binding protein-related protein 4B-like isoform X1 [Mangifera indica]|uniref:oxysterol-binding protein-related protein 4B-like isoform X1 n=1 Tax=Mangifera indica TaxID=29780 RepID=UPI001CF987EF|nr:oxysterol-binding protein-related protein 4B-like isoform X1 [Mangifera indica]